MVDKISITTKYYYKDKPKILASERVAALALLEDDKKNEKYVDMLLSKVKESIMRDLKQFREQLR